MKKGLTLTEWATLITVTVLVLGSVAGFVSHLVNGTETRVLKAIDRVDASIDRVDSKLDKHINMHLENKLCTPKETRTSYLGGLYYGSGEKKKEQTN